MRRYIKVPLKVFAWTGWIVSAILLSTLLFLLFFSLTATSPTNTGQPISGFVPGVGGGPPTDLNEPSAKQVALQSLLIQEVVNPRVMWVKSDQKTLLLVLNSELIPDNEISSLNLTQGQKVNIQAILKTAPDAPAAQKKWGLSADEADAVAGQDYYLLASQIEPSH